MPSSKVAAILRSKTDLSEAELSNLNDAEGWQLIYSLREEKKQDESLEVCFTGFASSDKQRLKEMAVEHGFKAVTEITVNLDYLCRGPKEPGPAKMRQAAERGVQVITEQQFISLALHGEVPAET